MPGRKGKAVVQVLPFVARQGQGPLQSQGMVLGKVFIQVPELGSLLLENRFVFLGQVRCSGLEGFPVDAGEALMEPMDKEEIRFLLAQGYLVQVLFADMKINSRIDVFFSYVFQKNLKISCPCLVLLLCVFHRNNPLSLIIPFGEAILLCQGTILRIEKNKRKAILVPNPVKTPFSKKGPESFRNPGPCSCAFRNGRYPLCRHRPGKEAENPDRPPPSLQWIA